jgi:hypothetical protein
MLSAAPAGRGEVEACVQCLNTAQGNPHVIATPSIQIIQRTPPFRLWRRSFDFSFCFAKACATSDKLPTVIPSAATAQPWRSRGTLAIVSRENEKSWLNRALRHPWPRCNGAIWFDFAPLRSAALTMTEGHSPPGHRAHHDGVTSQIVLPATGKITCSG